MGRWNFNSCTSCEDQEDAPPRKGGVFAGRDGVRLKFNERLRKRISGFGENNESGIPVLETLPKHMSRDRVQEFADLIREHSR